MAAHEISILQFMKDYGFEFRILEEPLEAVELGVAFSRSDDRGIAQALPPRWRRCRPTAPPAAFWQATLQIPTNI